MAWLLCLALSFAGRAVALSHERIDQLHHTAWTAEDGAPPEIRSMAQTHDGWLWLGSSAGLFRFDGQRFESIDVTPPGVVRSSSVSALVVIPTGEMWVGYSYGGISRYKDGSFTHYQEDRGVPLGPTVLHFEQDSNGILWALTTRSWLRWEGDRFISPSGELTLPAEPTAVLTDALGVTWILAQDSLFELRKGSSQATPTGRQVPRGDLTPASDGSVWLVDERRMQRLSAEGEPPAGWRKVSFASEPGLIDRDWNYWWIFCDGICRHRPKTPVRPGVREVEFEPREIFTRADGLSSKFPMSVLEDREGNIWVGGKVGLDRFRHTHVVRVPTGETLYFAMAPAQGGGIWLGTTFKTLPDQPYQRSTGSAPVDLPGPRMKVTHQYRDHDGSVWVGGLNALWHQRDGRLSPVTLPPGDTPTRVVQALARDAAGGLWMSLLGDSVYRQEGGGWVRKGGHGALPEASPTTIVAGDDGSLWFAYSNSRLFRLKGGELQQWGPAEGLDSGTVTAVHAREGTTLAAGALGLYTLDGQRFRRLKSQGRDVLRGITGIVRQRNGDHWFHGLAGLVRVTPQAMREVLASPGASLSYELFDSADGLPGVAQQVRPLPTLLEDDQQRLWLAGSEGLAWMDPARRQLNPHPPTVLVQSLRSDAGEHAVTGSPALPPNTGNVVIRYTALNLGQPERARFRYRLEGFDPEWRDVGPEREAHYTRLPPGAYTFEVQAANEDGVWSNTPVSMPLEMRPAFHQTWWFRSLAGAAAAAMLWFAYRWRMRQQAARMQLRLDAQLQERERIARDLHDTLLQSTQGLILMVEGAANQPGADHATRSSLERALTHAGQVLQEGRDRVAGLRAALGPDGRDLPARLAALAAGPRPDGSGSPAVHCQVEGIVRPLLPHADDEVFAIAREGLTNATRHAGASGITLQLHYAADALRVTVQDDGRGIDEAVLAAGQREGHWGLVGMRERATRLGGELAVRRRPMGGTEVALVVPARNIYPSAAWARLWRPRLRLTRPGGR